MTCQVALGIEFIGPAAAWTPGLGRTDTHEWNVAPRRRWRTRRAAAIWLILGGPALFLAGIAWFKQAVFRKVSIPRLTGLALLAATAAGAGWLSPLALSALASAVLVMVAI